MKQFQHHFQQVRRTERGASLIIVLLILVVVSLLGVGGAQIAMMSERGARNDRDMQVAWQAAEAALVDAELDMRTKRTSVFDGINQSAFLPGCGTDTESLGLCTPSNGGKPTWLTVDFTETTNPPTVGFGDKTGRAFAAGGKGIQPAHVPRYMVELIRDPTGDKAGASFVYRVTAMGFGPRETTQAVVQMIYRIK